MTTTLRGLLASIMLLCPVLCSAGQVEKPPPPNLLKNAGFEEPANGAGALPAQWQYESSAGQRSGVTNGCRKTGEQSLQMRTHGTPGGFQAIVQTVAVEAGSRYSFSVAVRNSSEDPFRGRDMSGAYGQLVIQWVDKSTQEVGRVWSPTWDHLLSRLHWELITLKHVTAPDRAANAVVGVHLYEGPSGALGSFNVDDITMSRDSR